MCEFSHTNSYAKDIPYGEAIIGSRFWSYDFEKKELKSIHQQFIFVNKNTKSNIPNLNDDLGLYSYNNNNYNNYYNNYYYNNYYNYYNNNNYYDNNNYYYIAGIIKAFGSTIVHDLGQRSQEIEILSFLTLKDHKHKEFLEHFNSKIKKLANLFGVSTIEFQFGENPIENYNKSLIL